MTTQTQNEIDIVTAPEKAIFKKYGYTTDQMNNLDFILTPQEINDLPSELTTAYKSYVDKMAKIGKSLDKKSTAKGLLDNTFVAFVTGVVLGFAAGYILKTTYSNIDKAVK
ncbi:MAG: hypothetical protein PHT69_02825 [Bacteroidales bacterium]|nr:hypothetical protein [Bacteroidales bacterium]